MYVLSNFKELYDIAKEKEFSVNLVNLSIKDRLRTIDFLAGLTFKNGKIEKINANIFKVTL